MITLTKWTTALTVTAPGAMKVEFLVDGVLKKTDRFAPFNYTLDVTTLIGKRRITVRVTDAAGQVTTQPIAELEALTVPA